jgi:hypothetical protein
MSDPGNRHHVIVRCTIVANGAARLLGARHGLDVIDQVVVPCARDIDCLNFDMRG